MKHMILAGLSLGALLVAACDLGGAKPEGQQGSAPQGQQGSAQGQTAGAQQGSKAAGFQAGSQAGAQPASTGAAQAAQGYDLSAIKAIPDNCSSPAVILATAPKSVGPSYEWTISRQALLANQQFRVVSGPPSAPGQVSIAPHEYNTAFALVARCADGGTCNQLAAMYKAVVRSSNPQVFCGAVPGISAAPVGAFRWDATPQGNLPGAKDTIGLCARLSACMIATDRSTPGDPFVACQKGPSAFKTQCATRYPCAEVLACVGQ